MASANLTGSSPRKATLWKGKSKAQDEDSDFVDIGPVLTYRHMLSQNLGVRDPLRVIALCDNDAFYAACEMNRLGVDKDAPLVVLQWDSLIAVNYPARKFGISRMDKKNEALKRCPHLNVVHVATYKEGEKEPGYWDDVDTKTHKVSLDYYRRESLKIASLFKECLSSCEIEKASIDEAFFDFTKCVREILLQRYPYLAEVPSTGIDTPLPPPPPIVWDGLENLIPTNPTFANKDKLVSEADGTSMLIPLENQAEEEVEDPPATWHDVALSIAAEMMKAAKERVKTELGYTTSAGIARNKFLAKLTASYKKYDTQSILRNAAIPSYLKPLQFQKIRFLGGKLGDAIAKEYDVSTVGDLLTIGLDEMQSKFGENSIWVYEIIRGIDRGEVKDKGSTLNKSMLASKNLPTPITKPSEGYHWIRVLAAELALRLRDAREMSPNLWPKTIALHARKGYQSGRSKQMAFPFTRDLTVDTIALAGDKLWNELVGNSTTLKVTNVQLAFTGISAVEAGQSSIEGFLKPASSKKRSRDSPEAEGHHEGTEIDRSSLLSYACPRCGRIITVPPTEYSDEDQRNNLNKLKMEHEDYHFAQDLAQEGEPAIITPTATTSKPKSKKRRKDQSEPKGIAKFFQK